MFCSRFGSERSHLRAFFFLFTPKIPPIVPNKNISPNLMRVERERVSPTTITPVKNKMRNKRAPLHSP